MIQIYHYHQYIAFYYLALRFKAIKQTENRRAINTRGAVDRDNGVTWQEFYP